ncbi:MAG: virulence RhuM family protein [Muribaculaceae bacterium]|nr:virulence RhuM family protein [Muribaculaceae bacterium]MDE7386866.1 virulence RhuM family protein [Muribaculaceae bacterium]
MEKSQTDEIVLYQPDEALKLNVRVQDESVWLNRNQIAELFGRDVKTIGKHVANALKEELADIPVVAKFAITASDGKTYQVEHYNLEMITSIGYRVKSTRGIQFRVWANKILKDYLLRGYSINQRLLQLEDRMDRRLSEHDRHLSKLDEKVDFFVRSSLQPIEGIFFNGQIFDAYALVADLIRQAKTRIALIDNYIDDSVLVQLSKRKPGVTVDIYDSQISRQLIQDTDRHNKQYPGVTLHKYTKAHDRFLIIDEDVYHIGASLKDLGKKLFAFSKMEVITGTQLINGL